MRFEPLATKSARAVMGFVAALHKVGCSDPDLQGCSNMV
jgi:hypothetical protein